MGRKRGKEKEVERDKEKRRRDRRRWWDGEKSVKQLHVRCISSYLSLCLSLSLLVCLLSPHCWSVLWKSSMAKAVFSTKSRLCAFVCPYASVCDFTGSEDYCYLRISSTCKTSSHLSAGAAIIALTLSVLRKKRYWVNSVEFTAHKCLPRTPRSSNWQLFSYLFFFCHKPCCWKMKNQQMKRKHDLCEEDNEEVCSWI